MSSANRSRPLGCRNGYMQMSGLPYVGSKVGEFSIVRSAVDSKGRIVLPKRLRSDLGLIEGSEVSIQLEKERLIVSKVVDPDEFVRDMEGFVNDDSALPLVDPLSLKRIWERD